MPSSLLIDIGPATGAHGARGIGRYVRGLATSVAAFPDELAGRVWAVGYEGPTLDSFAARGTAMAWQRRLSGLPAWATARLDLGAALAKSGARVFHATHPQQPWTARRIRSIVTVYDLIPLREPDMLLPRRPDRRLVYQWYIRQLESAARILAISRSTAEDLQERLGIAPERIDIVYPVVVPPAPLPRIEPPEPTFLFVGALDPHKRPELALRAFARFHASIGSGRLRYIGPAQDQDRRRLHELAAELGIGESVSIEGRISDEELENAYRAATALVLTSKVEGFGLPSVEAVLRGLPVIAVETRAATETLHGAAALVPADADAIANAMAHPAAAAAPAVEAMRERYSVASVARSLADCYRRMLD